MPPINLQPLADVLLPLVVTAVLAFLRKVWKDRAAERERLIATAAHAAYLVTTEVALLTPNQVDDKVAHALGVLDKILAAKNARPASDLEVAEAQLAWKAMHGAEKLRGSPAPALTLVSPN